MNAQKIWALVLGIVGFWLTGTAYAVPGRITTLFFASSTPTSITLSFNMPAPGAGLTLTAVECRKSSVSITTLNWASRTIVPSPALAAPGTLVSFTVPVAIGSTTYVGCKTKDSAWSLLSNLVMATTIVPATKVAVLSWTEPDTADSAGVVGYNLYWKVASASSFTASGVSVDRVTSAGITVPYDGNEYCFAATSRTATGQSGYSNVACTKWYSSN